MAESIRAGDFRICPSCGSRNKAAHSYCVRCSTDLRAAATATSAAGWARQGSPRLMRFLLAAGVIAALAVGLIVRTVFRATLEVAPISEDVRADSARTVSAPPPPPVSGWYPGANVPVAPDATGQAEVGFQAGTGSWSSSSFPVERANPYDVPGDPNASMVGIAPRAPRARAAMLRRRVFTDNDLLATRGGAWSAPAPAPVRTADADDDDSDDDD